MFKELFVEDDGIQFIILITDCKNGSIGKRKKLKGKDFQTLADALENPKMCQVTVQYKGYLEKYKKMGDKIVKILDKGKRSNQIIEIKYENGIPTLNYKGSYQ